MDNNHPGGLSPALLQHMHAVLSKQAGLYWEQAQTPLDGAADLAKFITSLESILQPYWFVTSEQGHAVQYPSYSPESGNFSHTLPVLDGAGVAMSLFTGSG